MNIKPFMSTALALSFMWNTANAADDGRQWIELPEMMQQHMLSNTREHLAALNEILTNMAEGELDSAAKSPSFAWV